MGITPNVRGYIAGLLDLKGNAYTRREGGLVVYINGVKSPKMQQDLISWIGGGFIRISEYEGERRGCATHCREPHFDFSRSSSRYVVSGYRALIVLHTLEPSMFEWEAKFATPYHDAVQRMEEITTTNDGQRIAKDMIKRGWEIP